MGLGEDMENLKKDIERIKKEAEKKQEKKFNLPKKIKLFQKKKNYVTLLLINENHTIDFKKVKIEDQTIILDLIPRLASAGYVMYYKKYPIIILPSWSLEPFSPAKNFEHSLKDGKNIIGMKLLLAKMESSITKAKTTASSWLKWGMLIGLALIIGYAVITGG